MAEDGDMLDFVDDVEEEENDVEEEENDDGVGDQNLNIFEGVMDTSSAQARRGKDIQGVPWKKMNITREGHRRVRLRQYRNHEDVPLSGAAVDKRFTQKPKGGSYYEFFHNSRAVRPAAILRFQFRNLIWATSKHDVYFKSAHSIMHWSSVSQILTDTLSFLGNIAPTEEHAGSLMEGFTNTLISTFAVKDDFLVAGGFHGEVVCKRLTIQGVSFCTRTRYEDVNPIITNAIEIYQGLSGGMHFMASNSACGVREYEMNGYQLLNDFHFPWIVNHTSMSPDRRLMVAVGSHVDGLLVDSTTGMTVDTLNGHLDYSFASAWHPDGRIFATGNQDKTCRVWDVRNLTNSVSVLKGNIDAVRSLRFSSDGQFLVVAEAADYVHVYNTKLNYEKRQEIDFFGKIAGVSLSPDDETLYMGVSDPPTSSLLEFKKRHWYGYLDLFV